jgi:hypothetical protein
MDGGGCLRSCPSCRRRNRLVDQCVWRNPFSCHRILWELNKPHSLAACPPGFWSRSGVSYRQHKRCSSCALCSDRRSRRHRDIKCTRGSASDFKLVVISRLFHCVVQDNHQGAIVRARMSCDAFPVLLLSHIASAGPQIVLPNLPASDPFRGPSGVGVTIGVVLASLCGLFCVLLAAVRWAREDYMFISPWPCQQRRAISANHTAEEWQKQTRPRFSCATSSPVFNERSWLGCWWCCQTRLAPTHSGPNPSVSHLRYGRRLRPFKLATLCGLWPLSSEAQRLRLLGLGKQSQFQANTPSVTGPGPFGSPLSKATRGAVSP